MGHEIAYLCEKLDFLIMQPEARKKHGYKSIAALAKKSEIPAPSLKTLKEPSRNIYGRISADDERKLSAACGFDPKWSEWRTGTADVFKTKYLRDAKPAADTGKKKRETGRPLKVAYGPQEVGGHRMASLRAEAVLSNDGERWPIKFHLRCRDFDGYGIKKGFIDLHCGEAKAKDEDQNYQQAFPLPGYDVTIRLGSGTEQKPSWMVKANSGILDDVLPDEPYCTVCDLADGDMLKATFSIYVKDVPGPDDYICQSDGQPIGRKAKKILDQIANVAVLRNVDGEVVLCQHTVSFEDLYADLTTDNPSKTEIEREEN